jgi:dihydroorotase
MDTERGNEEQLVGMKIPKPDDWHLHLRDGEELKSVVPFSARRFARAIVMPNLKPPVTTVAAALAYRERILAAVPQATSFEPLMTLYLTDDMPPHEIVLVANHPLIHACKLYPAGATTNSAAGVTDIRKIYRVLEQMEKKDVPLLVHGEVTDPAVDIFDREKVFVDTVLTMIMRDFPALRIVLEHVTTKDAVQFVVDAPPTLAATITVHHLLHNRNTMLVGGIRPWHYCLPVLKREEHRLALVQAATSGHRKFFLGTDSAPHPVEGKHTACGCAGTFTAHAALELYAEVFDRECALDGRFVAFSSHNGPAFYRLGTNTDTIVLVRKPWTVPGSYPFGGSRIIPLRAGETVHWQLEAA